MRAVKNTSVSLSERCKAEVISEVKARLCYPTWVTKNETKLVQCCCICIALWCWPQNTLYPTSFFWWLYVIYRNCGCSLWSASSCTLCSSSSMWWINEQMLRQTWEIILPYEADQTLEQVVQRDCGVSVLEDTQQVYSQSPEQPALFAILWAAAFH